MRASGATALRSPQHTGQRDARGPSLLPERPSLRTRKRWRWPRSRPRHIWPRSHRFCGRRPAARPHWGSARSAVDETRRLGPGTRGLPGRLSPFGELLAFLILEGLAQDQNPVNGGPDAQATEREQLQECRSNLPDVEAVRAKDAEYEAEQKGGQNPTCLLYTSPSPRDGLLSRMPSSA